MCRAKGFCFCCDLKAGAITAAVLTAISAAISLLIGILSLLSIDVVKDDRRKLARAQHKSEKEIDEITEASEMFIKIYAAIFFFSAVLMIISVIFLSLGISKKKPSFVMVWLVTDMLGIVGTALTCIIAVIGGKFIFFAVLISLAFGIYLWIVVYSFYYELREQPATGGQVLYSQQPTMWQTA